MDWFVRGEALNTARRKGGEWSGAGFEFQADYAVLILAELLTAEGGLAILRYEGAQDVDLLYRDGRQVHCQIKHYPRSSLNVERLADIVQGYLADLEDAKPANGRAAEDGLSFRTIFLGDLASNDMLDFVRQVRTPALAKVLSAKIPKNGRTQRALVDDIKAVLARNTVFFYPKTTPSSAFRLMAEARLVRFGVLPEQLDSAVLRLRDGLEWGKPVWPRDVAGWLGMYVDPSHPASLRSAITFAPPTDARFAISKGFYRGGATLWSAVIENADIERDRMGGVLHAMRSPGVSKVLIRGPSGAGKSTLARRAAYELHRCGEILVLELQDRNADLDDAWDAAENLARLQRQSKRAVWLILDDVTEDSGLMKRLAQMSADSPIKIIATTWRSKLNLGQFGEGLCQIHLGLISQDEAQATARALGRSLDLIAPDELKRVLETGQLLLLNLMLLGEGSPATFGENLLARLEDEDPALRGSYLTLCAFGLEDLWAPLSLLIRMDPQAERLRTATATANMVFEGSNGLLLRSSHKILSSAIIDAAKASSILLMLALAKYADGAITGERRLAVKVLEIATKGRSLAVALSALADLKAIADEIAPHCDYVDLKRLGNVFGRCELDAERDAILAKAQPATVVGGLDAAQFRVDWGENEPTLVFDTLISFYRRTQERFGFNNFLRFCMHVSNLEHRQAALALALDRLQVELSDPAYAKVVVDLIERVRPVPGNAAKLVEAFLQEHPGDPLLARSASYLNAVRLKSPTLATEIGRYVAKLIVDEVRGTPAIVGFATRAVVFAPPDERDAFFNALIDLASSVGGHERALVLRSAAMVAENHQHTVLQDRVGPKTLKEDPLLEAARRISNRRRLNE